MEPAAAVYFVCSLCVIEFARKAIFRRSRSGPGNLLAQIVDRKQRRCPKTGSLLPPLAAYRLFPLLFHSTQDQSAHQACRHQKETGHPNWMPCFLLVIRRGFEPRTHCLSFYWRPAEIAPKGPARKANCGAKEKAITEFFQILYTEQ